jgi:PPOX class probable F420-dependent enzyme
MTRKTWERFLRGRHVAVLGTTAPDGTPTLTPIWYLYRDGVVLMRTSATSVKALNIARDERATVCVQDERAPYKSVTLYGTAKIGEVQPELGGEIARHYLGTIGGIGYQRAAEANVQRGEEVTVTFTPQRVLTQDFSLETPLIGKAWLLLKRMLPPWL